jgi:RNA polymerase sigma factor (sigma-70 family)
VEPAAPGRRAGEARNALVLRYNRAIRNYVGALIRCEQDADEVAQEVVVRLKGQFAGADPARGSFRRMLTVATHNMVRNYRAKQRRQPLGDVDLDHVADEPQESDLEREGLASWKKAVLELIETGLMPYVQDLLPSDWRTRGELVEE